MNYIYKKLIFNLLINVLYSSLFIIQRVTFNMTTIFDLLSYDLILEIFELFDLDALKNVQLVSKISRAIGIDIICKYTVFDMNNINMVSNMNPYLLHKIPKV